ncbi:Type II restriction modification system endonuclease [Metamycoplasma alkalescens 14918]|uniref:Type II restriction modification system endonuclease n=1 Tax=Metamycoplasma alkalescens 14918 TaxID=1188234 RepID=N9U9L2_9BACT|nr:EcoRI family type II restriction endonuclease [Metamycoplasma alkalescens]ENY53618.1 Type II restriction modification system endonuclease [Metamycoplasma alkalescens 14918]
MSNSKLLSFQQIFNYTKTGSDYLNKNSSKQEKILKTVVNSLILNLKQKYPSLEFELKNKIYLSEIASELNDFEQQKIFSPFFQTTFISPDGGCLFLIDKPTNKQYPILISEMKHQGSNSAIKGNAIERLGKNVIALRSYYIKHEILPFVAFCSGSDFNTKESKIIDRLSTIAQFSPLNKINLFKFNSVNPGSYFCKESEWNFDEMYQICEEIATRSILYFASKYAIKI